MNTLNYIGFILLISGILGALFFCAKADKREIQDSKRFRDVLIVLVFVVILFVGAIFLKKS